MPRALPHAPPDFELYMYSNDYQDDLYCHASIITRQSTCTCCLCIYPPCILRRPSEKSSPLQPRPHQVQQCKLQAFSAVYTCSQLASTRRTTGNAGCEAQVDIWALGITAIEMAETIPPRWTVHPMRVIFLISREEPPRLSEWERWTLTFHDFVRLCLTKVPPPSPPATVLAGVK